MPVGDEVDPAKARIASIRKNRKAKFVGYRGLAKVAGYIDTVKHDAAAAGKDSFASVLSPADTRRLARFYPAMPGAANYENDDEFKKRFELATASLSAAAVRELQARLDSVFRSVVNETVMRASEGGKKLVGANVVHSVIRPYLSRLEFSAAAPLGIVRHAQELGVLAAGEDDQSSKAEEEKVAAASKKIVDDYEAAELARREARRVKSGKPPKATEKPVEKPVEKPAEKPAKKPKTEKAEKSKKAVGK